MYFLYINKWLDKLFFDGRIVRGKFDILVYKIERFKRVVRVGREGFVWL